MNKLLNDVIQEVDDRLQGQDRKTGQVNSTGNSAAYILSEKTVRIEDAGGDITLFDVIAPGSEFPYRTWKNAQTQITEIARVAIRLLDGEI